MSQDPGPWFGFWCSHLRQIYRWRIKVRNGKYACMVALQWLEEIRIWSPNFHSSLFFTVYLQLIIKHDIYPLFIKYLSLFYFYVVFSFKALCHSSLIMKNIKMHSYISKKCGLFKCRFWKTTNLRCVAYFEKKTTKTFPLNIFLFGVDVINEFSSIPKMLIFSCVITADHIVKHTDCFIFPQRIKLYQWLLFIDN